MNHPTDLQKVIRQSRRLEKKYEGKFNQKEREAIQAYRGPDYLPINKLLREDRIFAHALSVTGDLREFFEARKQFLLETIEQLDDATQKVPHGVSTLFRGVNFGDDEPLFHWKRNQEVIFPELLSTTFNPDTAYVFSGCGSVSKNAVHGCFIIFEHAERQPGLFVPPYFKDANVFSREFEILLARNTCWKVKQIRRVKLPVSTHCPPDAIGAKIPVYVLEALPYQKPPRLPWSKQINFYLGPDLTFPLK